MTEKRCTCKEHEGPNLLPVTEFYQDKRRRDGRATVCKTCVKRRVSNWQRENPERVRDKDRRWREAHPETAREWALKTLRQHTQDQAASLNGARHHRDQWTGPQLEIAARDDLTATQIAEMTGRTVYAVRAIRRRLRTEPKIIWLAGLAEGDGDD